MMKSIFAAIKKGLRVIDSLLKQRELPNKRLDLLSIDETARLQMNMMDQWDPEMFEKLTEKRNDVVSKKWTRS